MQDVPQANHRMGKKKKKKKKCLPIDARMCKSKP
jgi:hypothetical protein